MTYLCRLAERVSVHNKNAATVGAKDYVQEVKIQRKRLTLGSAVIVCICPSSVRASGGGSGLPWCGKERRVRRVYRHIHSLRLLAW